MSKENEDGENAEVEVTEVDETEMLDVLGAAVDEVTPADVIEANKEADAIENGSDDAGDKDDDDGTDTADDEGSLEDDSTAGDESDAGDDEGEDKDDKDEADDEAGDDAGDKDKDDKTDKDATDDSSDEEPDPINDPIPESTKKETATRIKSLIEMAKDSSVRAGQGDEIIQNITNTGADPDQYANTLGFLTLYNSTDPKDRAQALSVAQGVVRELSIELGEGTVDLLAGHDDLQAKVEADTLTEADAIEIATAREKKKLDTARTDAATAKTDSTAETAALINEGKGQLTALEKTLQASDDDYARLRPTFIAMLKPALKRTHASDWGVVAQELYIEVKKANPKVAAVAPAVPKNTPLRPKGGGGGSTDKEEPAGSALDAVSAAISSM